MQDAPGSGKRVERFWCQYAPGPAIDLATDRQAVAYAASGGVNTCQTETPGAIGFEPYCPYTVNPDASGTCPGRTSRRPGSCCAKQAIGAEVRVP